MTPPRVCFMGAYEPSYPRNLILRRGLALHGAHVVECHAPREENTRGRARALRQSFPALAGECDVILLAEFSQSLAPAVWRLARRFGKRLVVDAFTPLYDSAVRDRQVARAGSAAALRYRVIDWLSLHLADHVITDTPEHARYFASAYQVPAEKVTAVPVGASREWFDAQPAGERPSETLVLFYGSYIPLHGVDTILQAADLLRERADLHFELIGRGQTHEAMRALARRLALPNTHFCDPVPPGRLPALAGRADICLGIFGTTGKAQRVVPNKVYQALALGLPLISLDSPALRGAFTPGEHLLAVPAGDAPALAGAIARLADDPGLRARLGRAGRARMLAEFDERAVGRRLLEVLT